MVSHALQIDECRHVDWYTDHHSFLYTYNSTSLVAHSKAEQATLLTRLALSDGAALKAFFDCTPKLQAAPPGPKTQRSTKPSISRASLNSSHVPQPRHQGQKALRPRARRPRQDFDNDTSDDQLSHNSIPPARLPCQSCQLSCP